MIFRLIIFLNCERISDLTDVPAKYYYRKTDARPFDAIHDLLRCLRLVQSLLIGRNAPIWRKRELTHMRLSGAEGLNWYRTLAWVLMAFSRLEVSRSLSESLEAALRSICDFERMFSISSFIFPTFLLLEMPSCFANWSGVECNNSNGSISSNFRKIGSALKWLDFRRKLKCKKSKNKETYRKVVLMSWVFEIWDLSAIFFEFKTL